MTILDIVSKMRSDERVTVAGDEIYIDCLEAEKLLTNIYFQRDLAHKEVIRISIGVFGEITINIKE